MPELPEVETVAQGLKPVISGARIQEVIQRRGDLRIPFPDDLAEALTDAKFKSITRRAKYLLFELSNNKTIIAHLGMSGTFTLRKGFEKKFRKHDHLVMYLSNDYSLLYHDPRRFGVITLSDTKDVKQHALIKDLGVEPLDDAFNTNYLKEVVAGRSAPIKNAIMDQHLVVGVGNIYAAEALFLAKISPRRAAKKLTLSECERLVKAIKRVLQDAIKSGGSTLRDYVRSSGDSGYFQHKFNVYDREGDACFVCKTPIESMRQAGRTTFFCMKCQK